MSDDLHHPHVAAFLDWLRAGGRWNTARSYDTALRYLSGWLDDAGIAADRATTADLMRFQRWLAEGYRTNSGQPLARTTQATVVAAVRSVFRWMRRRGLLIHDPAARLVLPKLVRPLVVAKDHLVQQEAVALVETLVARVAEAAAQPRPRALALRDLALVCLALATGRRSHGLLAVRVEHLDLDRAELRVEREKARAGRVLPVAPWAIAAVRRYLADARPLLVGADDDGSLFLSSRRRRLCGRSFAIILDDIVADTVRRNPDLVALREKRITTHSLRVSFATMLFQGGCGIRSINELLLHRGLTETAKYVPVEVQELRRALLAAHPRA